MTSIVDECLKSISQINQDDLDGEMTVCESMLESYEKIFSLMEHYSDDELSSLTFFESVIPTVTIQEADAGTNPAPANPQPTDQNTDQNADGDDKKEKLWEFNPRGKNEKTGRKEKMWKSILLFIPRLIIAVGRFIYRWVKSLFTNKNESDQATKTAGENLDKLAAEEPNFFDDPDNLAKLILQMNSEEMENKTYPAFTYVINKKIGGQQQSTDKFNSALSPGNGTFIVYPPLNIDKMIENLQQYDANILKGLINYVKAVTQGSTAEDGSVKITQITNGYVEKTSNIITEFSEAIQEENKIAKDITARQKSTSSCVVTLDNGETNSEYGLRPDQLWDKFNDVNKLIEIINADDNIVANSVKQLTSFATTPEDGAVEALTKMLNSLKNVTQIMLSQVQIVASLTDGYMNCIKKMSNFEYLSAALARITGKKPTAGTGSEDKSDTKEDDGSDNDTPGDGETVTIKTKNGLFGLNGEQITGRTQTWYDTTFIIKKGNLSTKKIRYIGPAKPFKNYTHQLVLNGDGYTVEETGRKEFTAVITPQGRVYNKDKRTEVKPIPLPEQNSSDLKLIYSESYYDQTDNIEPLEY